MKRGFKRVLAILLAVLIAFPNVEWFAPVNAYAATYRNGAQSGPSTSYKNGKYYSHYTQVPITGDNRTDLLAIALSQLGYQEGNANGSFSGEVSGSSNYVEFSYNMGDLGLGYGGSDYPWCASFVSWCLYQSRCTNQGTYSSLGRYHSGDYDYIWKEISCSQWVRQLKGAGYFKYSQYEGGTYTPKSGDLVYFQNSSGVAHIGICLYTTSSRIYTVEGNTSDASGLEANGGGVYFKNYALSSSYLYGYGVLPYQSDSSVADIDYSGANPTPGLYVSNAAKYVYSTADATSYSYVLPRFSMFEVTEICSNGRLGGTFTINGETVKGYVANNTDRVIQLSSSGVVDPTADERTTLQSLITQAKAARHYNYTEAAIETIRTTYQTAVTAYANTAATEAELQSAITALKNALDNTGSNTIAMNNDGVYITGINKAVGAGDCIIYSSAHNGDGLITIDNANIRYTVNVVVKWDPEKSLNVVQSVTHGTGNSTPSIQLASDEYLLAAHDWETGVADSDGPVAYSATNYQLLSNLKVGSAVILSGATIFDTSGVQPCAYAKFINPSAPRINSRNEIVEAGDFTLFTPEFNQGLLTHANANIHNTLNIVGKWDNDKQAWIVASKSVGNGATDETSNIEITDGQIVLAGLAKADDVASQANYDKLNAAEVGDKIVFSGVSPTAGTTLSCAANVDFVDVSADEGEEGVVTGPTNIALQKAYQVMLTNSSHTASLTDGQAATDLSQDGTWFGFMNNGGQEGSNTDENGVGTVVIDTGNKYNIDNVRIHIYAGENQASIAQPSYVKVYTSVNGTDYETAGYLELDTTATTAYWASLKDIATMGRYVKFEVGPSGQSTWVFINEIEVYGTDLTGAENIALHTSYTASAPATSPYQAELTDGVNGTAITDAWFGFTTDTTLEDCNTTDGVGSVIINLGARYNINQVKAHVFAGENTVDAGAPESITVSVSVDGSNYVKAGTLTLTQDATETYWAGLENMEAVGRYVKLDVACTSTWTLLNEVEVYGTKYTQSSENNIALGASYIASNVPGTNFTADLTDDVASQIFQYGVNNSSWYGVLDTGDATTGNATDGKGIIVIDLGSRSEITGAGVHVFAGENDLGAVQPNYINVYISDDGNTYEYIKTIEQQPNATAPLWLSFTADTAVYARYVKLAVLVDSNKWSLLNEVQVYGTRLAAGEADEPDTTSLVAVTGTFNNWNTTPNMKTTEDENVVTTTMELAAGTYEFKVLCGNTWYGNSGTIEDTTVTTSETGWVMDAAASNCILKATGGSYTFTFNRSTNALIVTYSAASTEEDSSSETESSGETESASETESSGETESSSETETVSNEESSSKEDETTEQPGETTGNEESSSKEDETTEQPGETTGDEESSSKEEETTEQPGETTSKEEESSSKEEESSSKEEETTEPGTGDSEEDVTVNAQKAEVIQKPVSATYYCNDKAAALTVDAKSKDGGTLTYQWYKNKKKTTTGGTAISKATAKTYTPSTSTAGSYYYYCIITNTNASATGTKTAICNSGFAKVQVRKLANSITGVSSTWKKSIDSAAFKLPAKANGTIKFKSSNTKVATVSSNGTVTVKGIGSAYITITAGSNIYQSVSKKIKVQVVPTTVKLTYIASNAKKALSVKWEKMSGISGFKIQYSTTKDFKNLKTSYVGSLRHSKTRSDLTAGTRYYVRVCAYKKIGKTTYQGAYSNVKSFVVKSK